MIYTTLNKIREQSPCQHGWRKLLAYLKKTSPDDEPLSLATVLESNGLDDALWCLRAVDGLNDRKRLLAVRFARQVQHLMTDQRSLDAMDVAERYAHGQATDEELAWAARAAWAAAWTALDAARAALDALDAARAALDAAWAALDAAWDARDAVWEEMRTRQIEIFKQWLEEN